MCGSAILRLTFCVGSALPSLASYSCECVDREAAGALEILFLTQNVAR